MFKYIKGRWAISILVLILGIILNALAIYQGRLLELIVDTAVGNISMSFIYLVLMVIVYGIVYFIFDISFKSSLNRTTTLLIADVKNKLLEAYSRIDKREQPVARKISIIEKSTSELFDKYFENVFVLFNQVVLFLLAFLYLASKNLMLTALIFTTGIISVGIPQLFVKKSQIETEIYLDHNKKFINKVTELLEGITVITVFNIGKRVEAQLKDINKGMEDSHYRQLSYIALAQTMSTMLGFISLAVNVVFAGYLCHEGYISIGSVLAIMQVMNYALNPLIGIPALIFEIKSVKPITDEINELLVEERKDIDNEETITDITSIKLNNVSVIAEDKKLLEDVSLEFETGKKYLIVGKSGSGKSTLLKTILGVNEYKQGNVTINNDIELDKIDSKSWFKQISYVEQDGFVFNDTLLYNITLDGNSSLNDSDNLIQKTGLKKLVDSNNEKLNFVVGEKGDNISGGERKRIGIARALYKNPSVIIADEPNAGLDSMNSEIINDILLDNEKLVIATMHNYNEDTLKKYDEIICVDSGRIVGVGTYNYIKQNCSEFLQLVQNTIKSKEGFYEKIKIAE